MRSIRWRLSLYTLHVYLCPDVFDPSAGSRPSTCAREVAPKREDGNVMCPPPPPSPRSKFDPRAPLFGSRTSGRMYDWIVYDLSLEEVDRIEYGGDNERDHLVNLVGWRLHLRSGDDRAAPTSTLTLTGGARRTRSTPRCRRAQCARRCSVGANIRLRGARECTLLAHCGTRSSSLISCAIPSGAAWAPFCGAASRPGTLPGA